MDLHLRVVDDVSGATDIEVHQDPDEPFAVWLECSRVCYDEIGGEALNVRRNRTRHVLTPQAVAQLQCALPAHWPAPASMPVDWDETAFTLAVGRGPHVVEYFWSSTLPPEWQSLRAIVRMLLANAGVETYVV
jgi:hypothetical protein